MKLDELEILAEIATPGPWVVTTTAGGWDAVCEQGNRSSTICNLSLNHPPNADFIATANPATVLRLCELLREAQTYLEWVRAGDRPTPAVLDAFLAKLDGDF